MYLISIFLPFLSGLFVLIQGRFIGKFGVSCLTIFFIFLNFFISVYSLIFVGFKENYVYLKLGV